MHARFKRVVFAATDPKTGAAGSVIDLFAQGQLNHHTEVQGGLMADACGQVLRDFFAERRAQQKAERLLASPGAEAGPETMDDDVIPAGEATEVQVALPQGPYPSDTTQT